VLNPQPPEVIDLRRDHADFKKADASKPTPGQLAKRKEGGLGEFIPPALPPNTGFPGGDSPHHIGFPDASEREGDTFPCGGAEFGAVPIEKKRSAVKLRATALLKSSGVAAAPRGAAEWRGVEVPDCRLADLPWSNSSVN
jgi:hypothetical protein